MIRQLFIFLIVPCFCFSQEPPYKDLIHASEVFGKNKTYRIYLPEKYHSSGERYPVIYFFHGWGGRYYKDDSANLEYEKLGDLVNKYQVILVMWDGNMDESEPRPYNIGNHEDVKYRTQIPDYFTELNRHIDATYRTFPDRNHKGIIGFSMGGFMATYIAGKYPDKISAIVNMVGSPEFFIGYPGNHTLYPIRYTLENLRDVSFRLHNMDNCPLFFMNTEVKNAALWENLPNFEYEVGNGDHKMDDPGETYVFEKAIQYICNRFDHPVQPNPTWSHYDIYPEFTLWGYTVKSNKQEPGYIYLRNVSPSGFGLYTHKWLPDGPFIDCKTTIITPPLYKKGGIYEITYYKNAAETPFIQQEKADRKGRLHIEIPGDGYEISIAHKSNANDFIVLNHQVNDGYAFMEIKKENEIRMTLLNRGVSKKTKERIRINVSCADSTVTLLNAVQEIIPVNEKDIYITSPLRVLCNKTPPHDATPPWIKLNIAIKAGDIISHDNITIPVMYDVPYFKHIKIDDGTTVRDKAWGSGNGNGMAERSEQIMLFENFQRLRLYTNDPYIEKNAEILCDEMITAGIWPDGYTLSSIVKIADDCPPGHNIEFLANYETKTFMPIERKVIWGKVRIQIK